jgi:hypothetical protein
MSNAIALDRNLVIAQFHGLFASRINKLYSRHLYSPRQARLNREAAHAAADKHFGLTAYTDALEALEEREFALEEKSTAFNEQQESAREAFYAKQEAEAKAFEKKLDAEDAAEQKILDKATTAIDAEREALKIAHASKVLGTSTTALKKAFKRGRCYQVANDITARVNEFETELINEIHEDLIDREAIEKLEDLRRQAEAEAALATSEDELKAVWKKWHETVTAKSKAKASAKKASKKPAKKAKAKPARRKTGKK